MDMQDITITNTLPSGTAFAVTNTGLQDAVFVPGSVVGGTPLQIGDVVQALLVPNTSQPGKAPWLATRVMGADTDRHTPDREMVARTRDLLSEGGVWSQQAVCDALTPSQTGDQAVARYDAVGRALMQLFLNGECMRLALQHTAGLGVRVWYTSTPSELDNLFSSKGSVHG